MITNTVVKQWTPMLYKVANKINTSLADDLVQEGWLRAYEKYDSYDSERGAFSTWLRQVAYRAMLSYTQREQQRGEPFDAWDEDASTPSPEQELVLKEMTEDMVNDLNGNDAARLCLLEGNTYNEAAEALGISVMTVRRHVGKFKERYNV